RHRAHPPADGPRAAAAVPAGAGGVDRHQPDAVVARPRRPPRRATQRAPQDPRRARTGVRLVTALPPGVVAAAATLDIPLAPLPPDEVVEGTPSAGVV